MQPLFADMSWHDYKSGIEQDAYRAVMNLNEAMFLADLNVNLERIRERGLLEIPRLAVDKRRGKRREASVSGDDGRQYTRTVVDVAIPFSGDPLGFRLSPSRKTLGCRGRIEHGVLTLTLEDDDRLEQNLNAQVGQIEDNLKNAEIDLKSLSIQIENAIKEATDQRMSEIQKRRALDSKRSFPID